MRYMPGQTFLRDLCGTLGIDPDKDPVHSITLEVRAGDLPCLTVERYVTTDQGAKLVALVKRLADPADEPTVVEAV